MKFDPTPLPGAFVITPERLADERGWFARTFSRSDFERHGLNPDVVQCNLSLSARRGTLRGMHFQRAPHEETKLVRCLAGAVFDVAVDLRPGSATHRSWVGVELSAERRNAIVIPKGFAHGFLTLVDACELEYLISTPYNADAGAGVRWDDAAIAIEWPFAPVVLSERDASYQDLALT
jgi:dTDP-4-dehydrorhamnose 3,5-epimerase